MPSTMLATTVRIAHRMLQHNGIEADALFLAAGLDPLKLHDPQARYPLDRLGDLWRRAEELIENPCWGLSAGELWRPTDFHALGYAFLASATLASGLKRMQRYYSIVDPALSLQSITTHDSFTMTHVASPDAPNDPAIQDTRLSVTLRMCRDVYGEAFRLREVQLAHPRRVCGYEEHFGCPVRYDADRPGFTIPLEVMRRPLPAKNRDLARESDRILQDIERHLTDGSTVGRVRRAMLQRLSSGKPAAQDVARALAISPRTLQRKLQEEGTTFQTVLDAVRKELAQQYIRSGEYDLLEVTYLTGFANPPAFSRAYKKWTGRSPSEDRLADD